MNVPELTNLLKLLYDQQHRGGNVDELISLTENKIEDMIKKDDLPIDINYLTK